VGGERDRLAFAPHLGQGQREHGPYGAAT
jgi:hypothetical protein